MKTENELEMPFHIKVGLVVLAVGFAIVLGFFVDVVMRIRDTVNNPSQQEPLDSVHPALTFPRDIPQGAAEFT